LHPSFFESPSADTPRDNRDLFKDSPIQKQDFSGTNGKWNLTVDDNYVSEINSTSVFKKEHAKTLLTDLFFSKKNIDNLQDLIRFIVHRESDMIIDRQSTRELLVVMRSIFLEYCQHPPLLKDGMTDSSILELYTREVARLNELVVNETVPKIQSQIQQYFGYLRDISKNPMPHETPKNVNIKGDRQYRSVTQVLIGGDL